MIHYSHCPVCASPSIGPALDVRDYTVSHQEFSIWRCRQCTHQFTQDIPSQHEIGSYYQSTAYISHTDTKEGLVNRLYHSIRNITLKSKRRLLCKETRLTKGTMLDIGCGTGAFLHTMKNAGWVCKGLEPDELARKKAQERYHIDPMPSEELFRLKEKQFDAITMWHVLEHVHQLDDYMIRLKQILKENGVLFIAVPNYHSYDAAKYGVHWAAYDVPRHLYHFSPQSMQVLLQKHGFTLKKMLPMWFDSFYVSMLSEQYKNGKGNLINACVSGLISNCKAWANTKRCSSIIYVIKASPSK